MQCWLHLEWWVCDFTIPITIKIWLFGNISADNFVVAVLMSLVVPTPTMLLGKLTSAIPASIATTLAVADERDYGGELKNCSYGQ